MSRAVDLFKILPGHNTSSCMKNPYETGPESNFVVACCSSLNSSKNPVDPLRKHIELCQQAHDDARLHVEVKEMTGMRENSGALKKLQSPLLIRLPLRQTQKGTPSPFALKERRG